MAGSGAEAWVPEIVANMELAPPGDRTLLTMLRDGDGEALVRMAVLEGITPRECLARRGLPSRIALAEVATRLAVHVFLDDQERLEGWVVHCLSELSPAVRDQAVDEMLARLTDADAAKLSSLRAALSRWYASAVSLHRRLSRDSAGKLSAWGGLSQWDTFLQFIEQRCGHPLEQLAHLQRIGTGADDAQQIARRALGRTVVWRNYAARITGLRLYVPDRASLADFLDIPGASDDLVEHKPGVSLRLMVLLGALLVDVPLDDREPIRAVLVPRGRRGSFDDARSAVGDDPAIEFMVRGLGWQSHLYFALLERKVLPNDGLTAFEGVPRRHLDGDGLPRRAEMEETNSHRAPNPKTGKGQWNSPKKKR